MSSDDDQLSEITTTSSDATSSGTTGDTTTDTNASTAKDTTNGTTTTGNITLTDAEPSDDSSTEDFANDWDTRGHLLPQDILSLVGRHLRAEDLHWAVSPVPKLEDIIIDAARYVKGPELKKLMDNATHKQKEKILEFLPLDIPLKYTLAALDTGNYWQRKCLEKWPPSDVWRYHDNWKVMFVELTVGTFIENFVPGEFDIGQLKEFLTTFKEYNQRLKITQLKRRQKIPLEVDLTSENFDDVLDDFLAKPEASDVLIDFEVVLECLSDVKDLSLVLSPCSLDADSFQISVADFNSLLRGLKKLQKLENFRCSNGIFTNEQITVFCCLFMDYKLLKELNLSSNFTDDACCDCIGKLLTSSCPLEILVLKYNRICDEGAVAIASGLSVNPKLKRLDLSVNWIGDEGGEFLAKVVSRSATLEALDVSNNKFGHRAGLAFADMLKVSKSIRSFSVSGNNIGRESGRKLKEALEVNRTILNHHIQFCHISPDDEDSMYQALKRNLSTVNYVDYGKGYRNTAASEFVV